MKARREYSKGMSYITKNLHFPALLIGSHLFIFFWRHGVAINKPENQSQISSINYKTLR